MFVKLLACSDQGDGGDRHQAENPRDRLYLLLRSVRRHSELTGVQHQLVGGLECVFRTLAPPFKGITLLHQKQDVYL